MEKIKCTALRVRRACRGCTSELIRVFVCCLCCCCHCCDDDDEIDRPSSFAGAPPPISLQPFMSDPGDAVIHAVFNSSDSPAPISPASRQPVSTACSPEPSSRSYPTNLQSDESDYVDIAGDFESCVSVSFNVETL